MHDCCSHSMDWGRRQTGSLSFNDWLILATEVRFVELHGQFPVDIFSNFSCGSLQFLESYYRVFVLSSMLLFACLVSWNGHKSLFPLFFHFQMIMWVEGCKRPENISINIKLKRYWKYNNEAGKHKKIRQGHQNMKRKDVTSSKNKCMLIQAAN